ncbi:MAG: Rieske 2Fe-2S domain-containing protein, partial [Bryobacteraceae bacterium]
MQSVTPLESVPAKTNEQRHDRVTTSLSMFQLVPELGYREYWYPALLARSVGKRPKKVVMLGEELVFFRGESGKVVAFWDRCPHRGAL